MTALRKSSIGRSVLVAVMLLSWFVITNHCALAQMQSKQAASAGHTHCHGANSEKEKNPPRDGMGECCRTIKVCLADKIDVHFDAGQFQLQICAVLQVLEAPVMIPASGFFLDHGPPRAVSFAETILQRSLLSHAPPLLA